MKKMLLLSLSLLSTIGLSAQSIDRVDNIEPIKYEKQGGKLKILSSVELSDMPKGRLTLKLDGEVLNYETTKKSDSLIAWLPMIGQQSILSVYVGKKLIADRSISAPINSDWGYFKTGTIHIIQSSHQDIAWMNTPEYCREERINDIITPALDMMKEDPDFTFEMEQTLNLMEYLEAYPERKDEIIQRYKEGRFFWGATYNQPYEGLSSGEQLVRQAYFGRKWIKENLPGCDDVTANNIDVPGRTMQMAQIFAKSGIENLFISRMGEGLYDWYSPDGSKVFTYTPGNYGWASLIWKFFDNGALPAFDKLHSRSRLWSDYFKSHNIPAHYAVLVSCDATKPINFGPIIEEWNKIVDLAEVDLPRLANTTGEKYFEIVNVPSANMEVVVGERPNLWLYIHGPAHYQQTVSKREAGVLLPSAEMFTTINNVALNNDWSYPRAAFDRAWAASIYPDHGIGGKNGEITDQIFSDSLAVGKKIGAELLGESLTSIANAVDTKVGNIVVFNDLSWGRRDVALYETDVKNLIVKDIEGDAVATQSLVKDGKSYLAFLSESTPSVGYTTYQISSSKRDVKSVLPSEVKQGANYYQNSFYDITFGNGGIVALYDKSLGRNLVENEKFAFGDIIEAGYTGHGAGEFNRVKDLVAGDIMSLSSLEAKWSIVNTGSLFSIFENVQSLKNAKVVQRVTIFHDLKKIDFDVTLEDFNGTHNRQFRIMFPLDMKTDKSKINYEVPMGVAEVGTHEMKTTPRGWSWEGTYVHKPADTHPREIMNFISANGNGYGFTMSSCVAVADWVDPSREQSDYPVLQGILISSHKSCHGEGNWYHQTGTHNFNFSILGHNEGWTNGYQYGVEANHPLLTVMKVAEGGELPTTNEFITVSDPLVAIATVKKTDSDNSVIIRLTEMEGKDKSVTVTLPFDVKRIVRTNLIEDEQEALKGEGRTITLELGHHAIETYKLYL